MTKDTKSDAPQVHWGLVIHGGVGVIPREQMTPDLELAYLKTLEESLRGGLEAMRSGGTAVEGVVESIAIMEDSPLFNAGRGSNFTADGVVSMDAAIMVGNTVQAGAVAGVTDVRNPIRLARHVMEACPHVMLSGPGAETFAREMGIEATPKEFFHTDRRWRDLLAARAREAGGESAPNTVDGDAPGGGPPGGRTGAPSPEGPEPATGTVGAVALDAEGLLVAGTSTGGSANKKWGRIGDSPIIAAGTYAGSHCGVSCTGWGEFFIRHAVAHDIQARMAYLDISLREAAQQVVMEKLEAVRKGLGGIVALDREGNVAMTFNTRGMYRGWADQDGRVEVAIY